MPYFEFKLDFSIFYFGYETLYFFKILFFKKVMNIFWSLENGTSIIKVIARPHVKDITKTPQNYTKIGTIV